MFVMIHPRPLPQTSSVGNLNTTVTSQCPPRRVSKCLQQALANGPSTSYSNSEERESSRYLWGDSKVFKLLVDFDLPFQSLPSTVEMFHMTAF